MSLEHSSSSSSSSSSQQPDRKRQRRSETAMTVEEMASEEESGDETTPLETTETGDSDDEFNSKMAAAKDYNDDDEEESWNDYNEKGPWHVPEGAAMIVKQMAAEQIFFEMVNVIVDHNNNNNNNNHNNSNSNNNGRRRPYLNHDAIYNLLVQYPGLCHQTFDLEWDNQETRTLYPLSILCCLQPVPLKLLQFVHQANPRALSHAEPVKKTLAFHYACTFQAPLDIVQWMLELDDGGKSSLVQTPRNDGMYPLHLAAYFQANFDVVETLLQAWPQAVECVDSGRWTVLHAAASGQAHVSVLQLLYDAQPEAIFQLDEKRRTPLHLACWRRGNQEAVAFLLSHTPPPALHWPDEGAESPLFRAARNQSLDVLKLLLAHNNNVAEEDDEEAPPPPPPLDELGATLLHFAVLDNTVDVVEFLLQRYPDMALAHTRDRDRYTPLHGATHFQAPLPNIRALIRHAPTALLLVNGQGHTPLQTAREHLLNNHDNDDSGGMSHNELLQFLQEATARQQRAQSTTLPRFWSGSKNASDKTLYREDAAHNNQISIVAVRRDDDRSVVNNGSRLNNKDNCNSS